MNTSDAVNEQGSDRLGTLLAVNVGKPRTVEWMGRDVLTAIWKTPVPSRVAVGGINVAGDLQADRRVHGGPDKAVYAYAIDDYAWWAGELGTAVAPGTFGENLTVDGIDLAASVVGERWRVGTAILQVTQPRMPCYKLGIRMADAGFVERFDAARRLGVYFRIIDNGMVGAGDDITLVARPAHGLTATAIADAHATHDPELLRRVVATDDVPEDWREWATRQLGRAGSRGARS